MYVLSEYFITHTRGSSITQNIYSILLTHKFKKMKLDARNKTITLGNSISIQGLGIWIGKKKGFRFFLNIEAKSKLLDLASKLFDYTLSLHHVTKLLTPPANLPVASFLISAQCHRFLGVPVRHEMVWCVHKSLYSAYKPPSHVDCKGRDRSSLMK